MNSRSLGPPLSVSSPSCNHIVRCDALEFDSFTLCINDLHPTMISISTNHAVHHGSNMILILHHLSENTLHKLYFIQIITQDIPDILLSPSYKQERAGKRARKRASYTIRAVLTAEAVTLQQGYNIPTFVAWAQAYHCCLSVRLKEWHVQKCDAGPLRLPPEYRVNVTLNHYRPYFHSPLELCRLQDRLSHVHCMQSAKIAHYTHSLNHARHVNKQFDKLEYCRTKWETLPDRHIMCSHLTILPRQQSFELSGYDTQWNQYHSSSRSQILSVTIQNLLYQGYTFVLALTLQAVSSSWKILFYFHHIPLSESDGYVLSQPMAHFPTVDRLNRYIIKMIPLCPFICVRIHASPAHTLVTILVEVNRANWISLGLTCKE